MAIESQVRLSHAPAAAKRMAGAAARFLESLSTDQRAAATFEFEGDERYVWNYTPVPRNGLRMKEMTPQQREAAMAFMATGLSDRGNETARRIIDLETTLAEWEEKQDNVSRWDRDLELYWFSVFGEPGGAKPWGWRMGGHHLCLHYTVVDGELVSPNPLFFGANPAEVRHGELKGRRTLREEEDLARALLASLDGGEKGVAVVDSTGLVTATAARLTYLADVSSTVRLGATADGLTDSLFLNVYADFLSVSSGRYETCALTIRKTAYCFGTNQMNTFDNTPRLVTGGIKFASLTGGFHHACGIVDVFGGAVCWGGNVNGQVGSGSFGDTVTSPVSVTGQGVLVYTTVSAGSVHTCGLLADETAWCWGANNSGQLGVAAGSAPEPTALAVTGGLTFTQISAGDGSNKAVLADRTAVTLDRRILPDETISEVDDEIKRVVSELNRDHDIEATWDRAETYSSAEIPIDHPLAEIFREHSTPVADAPPEPWGIRASTDVRDFINHADIPAITWGSGSLAQAHTVDEYVDLDEAKDGLEILERAARTILSTDSSEFD
ncbi:MAG: M20/M25/M40 family metallo-hydrolase [Chloroflexi bacterium]|nr:M20/M25/M40 family metallo-hydrolase [Chloroflexota bacterium]